MLLTGANGYIGQRLLPVLLEAGHEVICCVRDKARLDENWVGDRYGEQYSVFEVDFSEPVPDDAPLDFDVAYYLIHSLSSSIRDFATLEQQTALHFREYTTRARAKQIIFLSGIVNEEHLSPHLESRLAVEACLREGEVPVTVLRAAIIIGSGSASFEIIRDLVEKLPLMVAPRWVNTYCQPIAIRNVVELLVAVAECEACYGQVYDIGGPDILTYRQMLLTYARVRQLQRLIISVPVMTPRLSSYWLFLVTSTSYPLAVNLVDSMHVEVIARPNRLMEEFGIEPVSYADAIRLAFQKIDQNIVVSSWRDALVSSSHLSDFQDFIQVPVQGVLTDKRAQEIPAADVPRVLDNIWAIGGQRGWYYGNWMWHIRGWLDRLVGGVGLRRGRTNAASIHPGDALDFWRVLAADKKKMRLLLFAEMRLPGEAWLEFRLDPLPSGNYCLRQVATFRPHGLLGRLYWYLVLPFHTFVFPGMLRNLIVYRTR